MEELTKKAERFNLFFYADVENGLHQTSEEMRSWEAELHRNNCETEMVKMTSNHQMFYDLHKERESLQRNLFKSEKRFLNLFALGQALIQSPLIIN